MKVFKGFLIGVAATLGLSMSINYFKEQNSLSLCPNLKMVLEANKRGCSYIPVNHKPWNVCWCGSGKEHYLIDSCKLNCP